MPNKIVFLLLITLTFTSCFSPRAIKAERNAHRVQEIVKIGSNIYEVREKLIDVGFDVGDITDVTGRGKSLNMFVRLGKTDSLDAFGYASGLDITPWRENYITGVRITSTMDGVVEKVEVR